MDLERLKIKLDILKIQLDYYQKILLLIVAVMGGLWVWGFANNNFWGVLCLIVFWAFAPLVTIFSVRLFQTNTKIKGLENGL